MEKKYFLLSNTDNNKIVKIIQVIFGVVCVSVAVFWMLFNLKSMKTDRTMWITIAFLAAFGLYEVWAGLGKAIRFIEISEEKIRLKKGIFLPAIDILFIEIKKIELFPFNINFFLKSGKKTVLRLGASFQETNEKIKDEIIIYSESAGVIAEIVEEKL
jgi:hypothetical protein